MNSIFGLMATSGGNFVSIAHLEIPLLIKMLMCQILIFPAVYIYIYIFYIYIYIYTVGTESIQTPLHFSLFVILQPFAKII